MSSVIVEPVAEGRGALCRRLLDALPDWFGIPSAVDEYVRGAESLPMLAARLEGERVGFVSLKPHFAIHVELYVLGVFATLHRRGIGRALVEAAAQFAQARGARILTVKTLSPSRANAAYERTRAFYRGVGFEPFEELPNLWGPANPCLILAKQLPTQTR